MNRGVGAERVGARSVKLEDEISGHVRADVAHAVRLARCVIDHRTRLHALTECLDCTRKRQDGDVVRVDVRIVRSPGAHGRQVRMHLPEA